MNTHTVVILNNQFDPTAIRIEPGDAVVWENHDPHNHAILSLSELLRFDAGVVKPGEKSLPVVFPRATLYGGVEVSCRYHGVMEGRVFVSPASRRGAAAVEVAAAPMEATGSQETGETYS